jgi:hypothetical protein
MNDIINEYNKTYRNLEARGVTNLAPVVYTEFANVAGDVTCFEGEDAIERAVEFYSGLAVKGHKVCLCVCELVGHAGNDALLGHPLHYVATANTERRSVLA